MVLTEVEVEVKVEGRDRGRNRCVVDVGRDVNREQQV